MKPVAMLQQLNTDPAQVERFIGDGFYQQQLVQQQVIAATGLKYLGDYTDNETEYQALMSAGVTAARQFDLTVGTALSAAQVAQLAAVLSVQAVENVYAARKDIGSTLDALSGNTPSDALKKDNLGVQLQIGISSQRASSQSSAATTTAKGSSVTAGGNVAITATGTQPGSGDVVVAGSSVHGADVTLDAKNAIVLQSAQSTTQSSSSSKSSGWGVSVGIGLSNQSSAPSAGGGGSGGGPVFGFTVSAQASMANSHGNGSSVTQNDTNITAGNTLTLKSGGDTTLSGAQVSGNTVNADIGGNLTLTSPQDMSTYGSNSHSAGISGSFSFGYGASGGSGSLTLGHSSINSNYASVNKQTGITAGDGGFDINVAGHTQLNGAVIASAASADKNSLTTDSLGYTNVQNSMAYSGKSEGLSTKSGPSFYQTGDSDRGISYAAIAPGTITVQSDALTGTDSTAGLSRDTANANHAVKNGFNRAKLESDLTFARTFASVASTAVGDVSDQLAKNNPAFAPGGVARTAMDAAMAGIGMALSGGNVAGAIAGSIAGDQFRALAQPYIEQAVQKVPPGLQEQVRSSLTQVVATAAGAASGAVAGGGFAGAEPGVNAAVVNSPPLEKKPDDNSDAENKKATIPNTPTTDKKTGGQ